MWGSFQNRNDYEKLGAYLVGSAQFMDNAAIAKQVRARTGAAALPELFARPGPIRIAGAHNPLEARLAERAGFDGVWSSGLEISASQGVPDADILTMTELLEVAGAMARVVDVPVVADGDAGYGNVSNVMHMIRRYEAAGIAAVSIEDKQFPKVNSFIPGRQELVSIDEFTGKIAAAKHAQRRPDFMVIARIEALVAGWGLDEALRRGQAYAEAGADAVLIHATGSSPEPIMEFLRRWRQPVPVVVVPTTYHTITADELHSAGAKLVIYANHGLRAGIRAVSETFAAILRDGRSTSVEADIAPLSTVFDLQGVAALKENEARFLRDGARRLRAVVIPGDVTARQDLDVPPTTLDVAGVPLLTRQTNALRRADIDNITVLPERSSDDGWAADTDLAELLLCVSAEFDGLSVIASDGVLFDAEPIQRLSATEHDVVVLVDMLTGVDAAQHAGAVSVGLDRPVTGGRRLGGSRVSGFGAPHKDGEFIGIAGFSAKGFAVLRTMAKKRLADNTRPTTLSDLLGDMVATGWPVHAVEVTGGWAGLRSPVDVQRAALLLADRDR